MSDKIRGTASFAIKRESLQKAIEAIREFVEHVKTEPGTETYISLQDLDDETRFVHFMIFSDEQAEDAHANSDAVGRFTSALYPETTAPVEFRRYSVVASA